MTGLWASTTLLPPAGWITNPQVGRRMEQGEPRSLVDAAPGPLLELRRLGPTLDRGSKFCWGVPSSPKINNRTVSIP
jgi:hypothetical protein